MEHDMAYPKGHRTAVRKRIVDIARRLQHRVMRLVLDEWKRPVSSKRESATDGMEPAARLGLGCDSWRGGSFERAATASAGAAQAAAGAGWTRANDSGDDAGSAGSDAGGEKRWRRGVRAEAV